MSLSACWQDKWESNKRISTKFGEQVDYGLNFGSDLEHILDSVDIYHKFSSQSHHTMTRDAQNFPSDYCFHWYFLTVPFNTLVLHQRHGAILMWHGRGMQPTERCLVFREKSWNDLEGYLRLPTNRNSILQGCNNERSLCLVPFPNSVMWLPVTFIRFLTWLWLLKLQA